MPVMKTSPDDLIDTTEACELLGGLHRSTLSRWVQIGRLAPARRVGKNFLFRRGDVIALRDEMKRDDQESAAS